MSATTTRIRSSASLLGLLAALLSPLAGPACAQPRRDANAVGVPEHSMLEDPFNRSLLFDELETHEREGSRALSWDATFWAGRAFDKLVARTEGSRRGGTTEAAKLELLWSHAATRWWDVVAGARTDFEGSATESWAAVGVRGTAPHRFGLEATAFIGSGGRSAASFEAEYELLITSRLILQPQLELDWYGQADSSRGRGSGLAGGELALRLRYEIRREVAPYVGVVRERLWGASADLARAASRDADDTSLVAGIRLRF